MTNCQRIKFLLKFLGISPDTTYESNAELIKLDDIPQDQTR